MKRLLPAAVVLGLGALVVVLIAPASPRGAAIAAAKCSRGTVKAVIAGRTVCLSAGKKCTRKHDSQYKPYGFHCRNGRLKKRNPVVTVAGPDQVVGLQDIDDHDKDDKHGKDKDKPEAEVSIAALFDDAGLKDTHTATINWGDGSATVAGKVIEPTATTDGAVTGKHTYTKAGTYTVTVTVKDDDGGVRSDTLKITVKAPVEKKNFDAKGDEYKLNEDTVLRVNAANGVLDNDRLPGGAPVQARVVEGPAHGKLTFNTDGSFVYVPERDFHGKDSFWYEFTDGNNVSQAVEVTLNVKDVKDKPSRPCIDWEDSWRSCLSDSFMPFGKTRWR